MRRWWKDWEEIEEEEEEEDEIVEDRLLLLLLKKKEEKEEKEEEEEEEEEEEGMRGGGRNERGQRRWTAARSCGKRSDGGCWKKRRYVRWVGGWVGCMDVCEFLSLSSRPFCVLISSTHPTHSLYRWSTTCLDVGIWIEITWLYLSSFKKKKQEEEEEEEEEKGVGRIRRRARGKGGG